MPPASTGNVGDEEEVLERVFERLFDEAPQALHERVESAPIRAACRHCHHNQVHTAALLGITRNVLRTQLKRLGLLPPARAVTPQIGHEPAPPLRIHAAA